MAPVTPMSNSVPRPPQIGGPTLLVRSHFGLFGLPLVLVASLQFRRELTLAGFAEGFFINSSLLLFVWLMAEIANGTIFRNRFHTAIPVPIVVIYGVLIGAATLLVGERLQSLLGPAVIEINALTLFFSSLLGVLAVVLSSRFEIARRGARTRKRLQLESQGVQISVTELTQGLSRVFDDLSEDVTQRLSKGPSGMSSRDALEMVIERCIKPLSKKARTRRSWVGEYFLIRGVTRDAIALRPFASPWLTAAIYSIIVFVVNQYESGERAQQAYPAAGFSLLILGVTFSLARLAFSKFVQNFRRLEFSIYFGIFFLVALAVTILNQEIFWDGFEPSRFGSAWLANATFLILVSVVLSALDGSHGNSAPLVALLSNTAAPTAVRGSLARATNAVLHRRLVQHLHGTVQNKVLALQLAYPREEPLDKAELEGKVLEIIAQAKHDFTQGADASFSERLSALKKEWEALAEVDTSRAYVAATPVQESVLFMVIQEAVTNSIRHGLATQISLSLSVGGGPHLFHLEVLDNGTGPLGKRRKLGLGLRLLSVLSEDNWGIEFRPEGGARLHAEIRC